MGMLKRPFVDFVALNVPVVGCQGHRPLYLLGIQATHIRTDLRIPRNQPSCLFLFSISMKSESTMKSEKFAQSSNWKYTTCLIVPLAASFIVYSLWTNPGSYQCHPDPYLTEERLVVLLNGMHLIMREKLFVFRF